MYRHLLLMSCASPKKKCVEVFFQEKQNRICAYHPNCIASLIPWEHFFSFYSIVSFCCGCVRVCAVAQSTSAFCFPLRGLLLICEPSLWDVLRKWRRYLWVLSWLHLYNNSCLTQMAFQILNCTNLDCLPCSSASSHYLQSKMKNKTGFTFNFVFFFCIFQLYLFEFCPNKQKAFCLESK